MIEHRLIDRMLDLMRIEMDRIGEYGRADPEFIDLSVRFIKEFADICHHGKEEKILFARLEEKPVSPDMKKMIDDLVQEHIFVRNLTNEIVRAKDWYIEGRPSGKADVISTINAIVVFYPRHVEKEEKHFFLPAMEYFSDDEKEEMLRMFKEFDSRLFHDQYRMMVSDVEDQWHVKKSAVVR
jgi:hemerythrin-like domain-containing protein